MTALRSIERAFSWLSRIPLALLFLTGAAVVVESIPAVHPPPHHTVELIVTVALLCILFDGGTHIGRTRFQAAAAPIVVVGVVGTFLTTVAVAAIAYFGFDLTWYASFLIGAAVAPTDPALVFSVLGGRQIVGRSSTILEGESGANDPVGIAMMVSLLSAGSLSGGAVGKVAWEFAQQMTVGAAMGLAGGLLLLEVMRRISLPRAGFYFVLVLGCALGFTPQPPLRMARGSLPFSSPESSSAMSTRLSKARSSMSTRRWRAWRRWSPSWSSG